MPYKADEPVPGRPKQPPRSKSLPAKGRLGQLGVNLIERVVLQMGSRWTPAGANEIGIDGYVELFEPGSGRPTRLHLSVQSKAVTDLEREGGEIVFRCRRIDVDYWLEQVPSVVVVVSQPSTDEAYWFSVQSVFGAPEHDGSLVARLDPRRQRFTARSYDALLEAARPPSRAVVRSPAPQGEPLFSNLIPLESYPPAIFVAPALCSGYAEARTILRRVEGRTTRGWVLHEKNLLSFEDPRTSNLRLISDADAADRVDSSVWGESSDQDQRRLFVWLLKAALEEDLGAVGVRFFGSDDVYAFKGTPATSPRTYKFQNVHRESEITVVSPYSSTSKKTGVAYPYLRHLAFKGRFRRLATAWFLEVNPTYRFTTDGNDKYRFHSQMLAGIKRYDGNRALLSQLLLWANVLAPKKFFGQHDRLLGFGAVQQFRVHASVPDDDWSRVGRDRAQKDGTLPLFATDLGGLWG